MKSDISVEQVAFFLFSVLVSCFVHKFQTISGEKENLQNNGLVRFSDLPKTKRRKREKVLYVKSPLYEKKKKYIYIYIYKRKRHEIRRVLTQNFCLLEDELKNQVFFS
jgi:hypothetical protein